MPGRGDGDGGRERGNTKKRALDDALQALGLGAVNPDAKRRHTAGGPGHHNSNTSTSSSFNSSGQAGKSNSPSKPSKFQLDTPLFPSRPSGSSASSAHQSWKPPKSTGSPPRASGALGGPMGANSGHTGLPLSTLGRLNHRALKQPSVPNGPPTSSGTSSDAFSFPAAGSTKTSATNPFKQVPEVSSRSLRFGQKLVNRAAAGESNPQTQNKAGQGARPLGTEQFAVKQQNRQSGAQYRPSNPSSHTKGKSTDPYELSSSDDGLYVDSVDDDTDQDDDDNAASFPSTRQRSARLKSQGSDEHAFQNPSISRLGDEHTSKHIFFNKTPSGKDYHVFKDEDGQMRTSSLLFFPDGWTLRPIGGLTGLHYLCPVRTCQRDFNRLSRLKKHFKRHHGGSKFNDNMDEKGTLEIVGRTSPGTSSIVVSQNPRFSLPGLAHRPYASHKSGTEDPIEPEAIKAGVDWYGAGLVVGEVSEGSPDSQDMDTSAHEDDEQDSTSMDSSELHLAMAESKVWAYVAPMVLPTWPSSVTGDLETRAFIQAISLPLRNKMDEQWLEGTKRSHQKTYRALMSTIFQVIGVEALCKPCESKIAERRRNCKILPPEAEGMRELQEVYGSQCVNCYFFHAAKSCEFPTSSSTTKQTPVAVPAPSAIRPMSNGERSLDPLSFARPPPPAATRPPAPSYSFYKATKADKPISESPVPIPSFAMQPANHQSQQSQTSDAGSEKRHVETMRRSRRVAKTDDQFPGSSSVRNNNADEAGPHCASSAASSTSPSESVLAPSELASGGLSAVESTTATSNSGSGVISSSQLAGRAFSLFGDISRLPFEEQTALWTQMQQMAEILQTGTVTKIPILKSATSDLPTGPPAVAAEWEIAPGRITVGNEHLAFSTSFLSRNSVSMKAAQQLSPTQRVLNKSMAAPFQLRVVREEEDWECTCSVIRGVLKMSVGDVETKIGQGGVIVVKKECIITNISHKEARLQIWWRKTED